MAAHTGQEITYDDALNSEHEMAPGVDKLTMQSVSAAVVIKTANTRSDARDQEKDGV